MDRGKIRVGTAFVVSGILILSTLGSVSASSAKYSTVSAITEGPKTSIQYGEGIINTVKNSSVMCPDKAFNVGNGGEVFYFSSCGFPNVTAPKFEADNELLNLWQVGHEDIRSDIMNKAKFSIYSSFFQAIENSYEVDTKGTTHTRDYTWRDGEVEKMKKNIPDAFLISQSGSYKITAMNYLWSPPEIAPMHYYTTEQKEAFQKFEKKTLALIGKLGKVTNAKTLESLRKALEKSLKNAKAKMGNDTLLLYFIAYKIVSE